MVPYVIGQFAGCDVVMDEDQILNEEHATKQANVNGDNMADVTAQNDGANGTDDEDNLEEFDQCNSMAVCPAIPLATIHPTAVMDEDQIFNEEQMANSENGYLCRVDVEPGEIPNMPETPTKRKRRQSNSPQILVETNGNLNNEKGKESETPIKRSLRLAEKLAARTRQ